MITAFVGTPGSGKTYDAVEKIIANMRKIEGKEIRHIYTNIEGMDEQACQHYLRDYVEYDDYDFRKYFHYKTDKEIESFPTYVKDNSLIVIDEIHKRFSNRDWASEKNKIFADWCSTHRHHGCDLIFITQDMDKVEKHVRSLIQWTYLYRKVDFMGGSVNRRYIKYSYSGDDTSCKPLKTSTGSYNPAVFPCYKSYTTEDAKEVGFMTHVNIFKHPVFFAIPVVLAFTLYLVFGKSSIGTGDILGSKAIAKKHEEMSKQIVKPQPVPDLQPDTSLQPQQLVQSAFSSAGSTVRDVVRVVGVIIDNKKFHLLLSDGRMIKTIKQYQVADYYPHN